MFGYCFKDDCLCLVTEYIPKGDLSKYMFDKAYVMDPLLKLSILLTICRGMSYLHNKNVIHCDLKVKKFFFFSNHFFFKQLARKCFSRKFRRSKITSM